MNTIIADHRNGFAVISKPMVDEICGLFTQSSIDVKAYSANTIKKEISTGMKRLGWSDVVQVGSTGSKITITAAKDDIGLCMQTGNVARAYADLLKLQTLFLNGAIKGGIIIVPTINGARALGSNIANLDRLERELILFSQVITMPIVLIGFEG
jgi:hypothetical protein